VRFTPGLLAGGTRVAVAVFFREQEMKKQRLEAVAATHADKKKQNKHYSVTGKFISFPHWAFLFGNGL
jgi:hypothetical protein